MTPTELSVVVVIAAVSILLAGAIWPWLGTAVFFAWLGGTIWVLSRPPR